MNRFPGDKMDDIDKHSLIWEIFLPSSMNAAVFLGRDHSENMYSIRNTDERPFVKKWFEVTQKIDSRTKIGNLRSVRNKLENFSTGKAVLGERRKIINLSKAIVDVFSDSVLCLFFLFLTMTRSRRANAVQKTNTERDKKKQQGLIS